MCNGTLQRLDLLDVFFGERMASGRAVGVVGRHAEKEGGMIDVAPALDDGEDWGESECGRTTFFTLAESVIFQ